jgi:hypothetical protein
MGCAPQPRAATNGTGLSFSPCVPVMISMGMNLEHKMINLAYVNNRNLVVDP